MKSRIVLLSLSLSLAVTGWAGAQEPATKKAAAQAGAADQAMLAAFARQAPAVGERLPEVTIVDAEGQPFELASLKGHFTVLTFGCLT
jgi:cytochrome oxidase Cu insertion factor (SCO1/SenC/PrrC family)